MINYLIFADNESVVSSSICVDSANHNHKQSHVDLTKPHHSQAIEIRKDDNVSIEGSEGVAKKRSKTLY